MIGSEGLKGKIRNIANSKNLRPQEVLQMFFFERFLERLSKSKYNLICHQRRTSYIFYDWD